MGQKNIKHIAIIFGKEDNSSFDRYTFPLLGRPAVTYPLLAAANSEKIDKVFLSSDSNHLLNIGKNIEGTIVLKREKSMSTLTEEVRNAVNLVVEQLGNVPETITILLANSPCINSQNITDAIIFLEKNINYDSVATTMRREEFNPLRIFSMDGDNKLVKNKIYDSNTEDAYFLDRRLMVVRTEKLLSSIINNDYFEGLLGTNIHPFIQTDGIWDIDYIWQVPIVERWLKQNGFTESGTPYSKKNIKFKSNLILSSDGKNKKVIKGKTYKALITTIPFGVVDPKPLDLLNSTPNIEYVINPIGRKLKENELAELVKDFDIIIAGTEPITRKVMENGPNLKLISRVGIGLDSVDLKAAKDLGITVSYTPDAPAPAVAELTIGHMINLLRRMPLIDRKLRSGIWQRLQGERLANMAVGIIGTGRVGGRVLRHLQGFNPRKIFVNDLKPDYNLYEMYHAAHVDKNVIYEQSDILTLHVPLTPVTYNMINKDILGMMKKNVLLINTSRGGIINEHDLYEFLSSNKIAGASIDVFENEPYSGNLIELDNCILSCHMGSMTNDCRAAMEIQATEEACRFVKNEPLIQVVSKEEYDLLIDK